MSLANINELIRRNPNRLSIAERDEDEARKVAIDTGRYITRGNGSIQVSKTFVQDYVDLCEKHRGF